MRELEPGAREGIGERLRIVEEPARDLAEFRSKRSVKSV